jgi:hypothetical protein
MDIALKRGHAVRIETASARHSEQRKSVTRMIGVASQDGKGTVNLLG